MRNYTHFLAGLILLLPAFNGLFAQQSPGEWLPYPHGDQFTPHHQVIAYYQYIDAESDRVQLVQYGTTNEGRPLYLAFVSTPENLARLEEIRTDHLKRAGLLSGSPASSREMAIVWLSFGVHGNEAGATESGMAVIHALASATGDLASYLSNTLVIIDPSLNPDGYDRYVNWYRQKAPFTPDPQSFSWEHNEPWPAGRVNHYLFDLNRDWAWATQAETRQRLTWYRQWMPHVHADFHEQYPNDPYYFAPAAEPIHPLVTPWQRDFQTQVGRNHTRYFDREGWLYFTREWFDLLYPSYGDTYPSFNGSVGMTYEQAGHGRSGRAYLLDNGDTLTLADRIAHHGATALSTVEMASRYAPDLVRELRAYFEKAESNPTGQYQSYILSASNHTDRLRSLCELLDLHGIRYERLGKKRTAEAYDYSTGELTNVDFSENDLLIRANQPMGNLVQALFEPEPLRSDSLTYDITAWALPYAYGLQGYALSAQWEGQPFSFPEQVAIYRPVESHYAYLLPWSSLQDARFLARVLQEGVVVRRATKPFVLEGTSFKPGDLVITRGDNRKNPDFDAIVQQAADETGRMPFFAKTGFSDSGPDLGSANMRILQAPRILLVAGEMTSENNVGEIWYYFEQVVQYPVSLVNLADLSQAPLHDYDLILLPDGQYSFDKGMASRLEDWLAAGGRIVAIGSAINALLRTEKFHIETKEETPPAPPEQYGDLERHLLSYYIPGAVIRVDMDPTHPLAYGIGEHYFSLKTSAAAYKKFDGGQNVGSLSENLFIQGFVGYEANRQIQNSLIFGVEQKGAGAVIYLADNPLFRCFWETGQFLFANAVFQVR